MGEDIRLPFDLPAVARKKVSAAFDGGRITSDGGVMLLAQAERRLGIADHLARVIPDERDADRVIHPLPDILRARIFAIACGYEDADDLDRLRFDPALKLACGRLPDTGRDLCSQPTVSRWENAPTLRDLVRLMGVSARSRSSSASSARSARARSSSPRCSARSARVFATPSWSDRLPPPLYSGHPQPSSATDPIVRCHLSSDGGVDRSTDQRGISVDRSSALPDPRS